MTEIVEPGVLQTPDRKRKLRVRPTDIIIFAIIIVVCVSLGFFIYNRLVLKRDVANAQTVSNKLITAIEKRDGSAARALGDKDFQDKNSAADLTTLFKSKEIATLKTPVLDRQTAYTNKNGRTVFFIYKYTALKVPYYVRVGVHHTDGKWQIITIDGNINEAKLVI